MTDSAQSVPHAVDNKDDLRAVIVCADLPDARIDNALAYVDALHEHIERQQFTLRRIAKMSADRGELLGNAVRLARAALGPSDD